MFHIADHSTVKMKYSETDEIQLTRHLLIEDDLPIDHPALQYALLRTGQGISVNDHTDICMVSDPETGCLTGPEQQVLPVPGTFEEFLELMNCSPDSNSAIPTTLNGGSICAHISHAVNPLRPNTFLVNLYEDTPEENHTAELLATLRRTYILYRLEHRDIPPAPYKTVTRCGIRFTVTHTKNRVVYTAQLDPLLKSAFAKAVYKLLRERGEEAIATVFVDGCAMFTASDSEDDIVDDDTCFYGLNYINSDIDAALGIITVKDYVNFPNVIITFKTARDCFDKLILAIRRCQA